MMKIVTDEQLSAYLDGAGDPEICEYIDRAIEEDAELRARMERLHSAGGVLRDAIDAGLGAVPERLNRIAAGTVAVAPFGAKSRQRRLLSYAAMAASLLIAFGAGLLSGRVPDQSVSGLLAFDRSGLTAGPELARAISTAHSGMAVKTADGDVVVALSFVSSEGNFCRQFTLGQGARSAGGVACRKDGGWLIEGWALSHHNFGNSSFATASGPSNPAIEAVIDRLGVKKSLNNAEENAAIKSGWENGHR